MNIATVGTGSIVELFLEAVEEVDGMQCIAVYSRTEEKAEAFADKLDISAIYTDLEEMFQNDAIDFIYIASPNSLHYEQAKLALQHGKNVICEKPFTANLADTKELIALAKEKNLMLFEAISTIHMPNFKLVEHYLKEIGPVKIVQTNYSQLSGRYKLLQEGELPNVFNPKFAGGALMDLNVYNLHFVTRLFGKPEKATYKANRHENGIDTSGIAVLEYDGFHATCVGAKDTKSMNFAMIQGEKGYINVVDGANGCREVLIEIGDREITMNTQLKSNRLYYEVEAFRDIFKAGDYERCHELLDHTLVVAETMEEMK